MLNKNTVGIKKAQSKANRYIGVTKSLILAEAKKLLYQTISHLYNNFGAKTKALKCESYAQEKLLGSIELNILQVEIHTTYYNDEDSPLI